MNSAGAPKTYKILLVHYHISREYFVVVLVILGSECNCTIGGCDTQGLVPIGQIQTQVEVVVRENDLLGPERLISMSRERSRTKPICHFARPIVHEKQRH